MKTSRIILFAALLAPLAASAAQYDLQFRQQTANAGSFVNRTLPAGEVVDTWAKFREESGAAGATVVTDLATATELPRSLDTLVLWRDVAGDITLTDAAGTPAEGSGHVLTLKADSTARTVTFPTTYSEAVGGNITSLPLAANQILSVRRRYLDGQWLIIGDPPVDRGYVYVGAGAMISRTTAGAATSSVEAATNDIMVDSFLFAGDGTEATQWAMVMPDDWDLGTVKMKLYWDAASGATAADKVSFDVRAGARSNDDPIDAALGTAVEVDDVVIAVGDVHVTAASAALTVGGTPALGDMLWFQVERDHDDADDDMTEDLKLLGVMLQYTKKTTLTTGW